MQPAASVGLTEKKTRKGYEKIGKSHSRHLKAKAQHLLMV
jgi:hypothetical protein